MASPQPGRPHSPPPAPQTLQETGLSFSFLVELVLRYLFQAGQATGHALSEALRLPYLGVLERVLSFLKKEKLVDVIGSVGFGERGFQYVLTDAGLERARAALERNAYVGPAPVPLTEYWRLARQYALEGFQVGPEELRQALSELVLSPQILERLGPAANSRHAIFLYGPPGNGKTRISEGLGRLLPGGVWIPYALYVEGHVIRLFDPLVHRPLEVPQPEGAPFRAEQEEGGITLSPSQEIDGRWVYCARPLVVVGGELTLAHLELMYDPTTHIYEAPYQMKANGGLLLIDDFGRQQIRPQDLLNRWIVPLERRIDYLSLHTGQRIQVPFEVMVIFSTNLDPKDLVDEAFLRRIRHKVYVGDPSPEEFREILRRVCRERGVAYSEQGLVYLLREHYAKKRRPLRGVHPRDLVDQILDIARFLGVKPALTPELIDRAVAAYFVEL